MTYAVDENEQQRNMLRDSAAGFCRKHAGVERLRALQQNGEHFDTHLWYQMAEMGWVSLVVPEDQGGLGLGLPEMAVVAEELGKVVAPEPLVEVAVLAVSVLAKLDPSKETSALMMGIAGGEKIPVVAVRGNLPEPYQNGVVKVADGFVLNGVFQNVSLIESADGFIAPMELEGEPALFFVDRGIQGVSITANRFADAGRSGTLSLNEVHVSAESLLGQGKAVTEALNHGVDAACIIASSYLLGLMARTLEITLDYLRTRQQFGRPIGAFQALQHRAVNLYIQQEVARSVVNEAVAKFDNGDGSDNRMYAVRAKHRATKSALLIVKEAIQLHGAIGFTQECDVSFYVNRALVLAAQYGNVSQQVKVFSEIAPYAAKHDDHELPWDEVQEKPPADKDWNAMSDRDFRIMVRQFFEREYPSDKRFPSRKLHWSEIKDWYQTVYRKGWVAPNWPSEYGGMGLEPRKLIIFIEEQERWGVARTPADLGLTMVGPMLIHHGNAQQRDKYLPRILSGDDVWCQGYSEPNAGSDLASLRTEAVLDGDEFVVNGQKTWTTLAQDANWMFLLARTDKEAKKQAGISFLLVDFSTPGITIRPIKNLAGNEEFCEVFLDNVRVPKENLVGELNQGWTIAKSLLTFERLFLGSPKQSQYALQRLAELAGERGLFDDPAFLEQFTRLRFDVLDLASTYSRFAEQVKRGEPLGADISILKIWGTETCANLCEFLMEAAGYDGAMLGPQGNCGVDVLSQYYYSRPGPIYGGTNEIQRNILAKQILELP